MPIVLTNKITRPDIVRWLVDTYVDDEDATPPSIRIGVKVIQNGGAVYGYYNLALYDALPGSVMVKNESTDPRADAITLGTGMIENAYSQVRAAWAAASGNRAAHKAAIEPVLLAIGVVQPSLGGAQP